MQLQESMMISRYQDEVTVDDESFAKMSGGDVDVEPFLVSRNTLGNDEPQLKFSKPNAAKFVGVCSGRVVVRFGVSKWVCGS